jgi:hypothetical protein
MNDIIFVNVKDSHTYHCENSKNILFRKKLFRVFFDDIFETSIALFHNNAWKIRFVFNNVDNLANHWVVLQFKHGYFSFGLRLHNTLSEYRANLILEPFCCICFPIHFRLNLKDSPLTSCFYDFY